MKNTKKIFSVIALLLITFVTNQSMAQSELTELKIKSSVVCDMCRETIEKYMAFEKGVKKTVVDVESKVITVTYNADKTTPEKIRQAISKSGYDADDVPANAKAYKKLDGCCKKDAVCNDKK